MSGLVDAVFGGGGDAPPPPDYAAAAKATAQGNKEAAQFAVNANRINQYTPYGSLTYSRKQPTFDQAGYDKAMAAYQSSGSQQAQRAAPTSLYDERGAPRSDVTVDDQGRMAWVGGANIGSGNTMSGGVAPRREDFMAPDDGGGWEQRMELTPQAQATLDKQMALSDQYADTASKGFENVQGLLENPNIDTSGMPQMRGIDMSQLSGIRDLDLNGLPQGAINPGMTAQEAILSRLNPTLASDEDALRTRLSNQGIGLGSTAYNREMALQGQRGTDLRLQAAAQGISLDQAARQQAFGERQALSNFDLARNNQQFGQQQNLAALSGNQRNQALQEAYAAQSRPLDLVNALRTGAQVQNPQFNNFAQQATTSGANMLGAAQSQYGAELGAYNAQNAQQNGLLGGIAGIGLGLAGLPGAGGSILKGAGGLFG
jgi:hypothetical protein